LLASRQDYKERVVPIKTITSALLFAAFLLPAQLSLAFDPAEAFGARQGLWGLQLSPDGKSISYLAPAAGQGTVLYTWDLAPGSKSRVATSASGNPERLESCRWVSNDRLVCNVYAVIKSNLGYLLGITKQFAMDRSGANLKMLSTSTNYHTRGWMLDGGYIIDWMPDEDGSVLMMREYVPDEHLGTRTGSKKLGWGVDRVDTRTLEIKQVERPDPEVADYISDGQGTVRMLARSSQVMGNGQESGIYDFFFRPKNSRNWYPFGQFNAVDHSGFGPVAVDHDLDVVYGLKKLNGRLAAYSMALDGSKRETLLYANPDVDVGGFIRVGRNNRVVGAYYSTEATRPVYLDATIDKLMSSLAKALSKGQGTSPTIDIVDASVDEQVLLIFASSDDDPGVYYVFDRRSKELQTLLEVRSELDGVKLAHVQPIEYPAADGVKVPGYLTLPPGAKSLNGLPAIVLPHGGPSARDLWGFDWLSQYYAAMGFAVLQPNFRGSAGYGDAWLHENGFKAWHIAIGDVLDAGRWLVAQGADPAKLSVVGWSYGGYAALQSAVTDPSVFKAVVAIAPVTDLEALKEEARYWSTFNLINHEIGEGAHVREGSPARHADQIKVPVLLFHGTLDRNVDIAQSKLMASKLSSAGVKYELVTFEGLDHYLEDSGARTKMLRKSTEFIKAATDK
jgi:acetyl esterase/lipase